MTEELKNYIEKYTKEYDKHNSVLFYSKIKENAVLSNMHMCNLKIGKWKFFSVEHMFSTLMFSDYPEYQKVVYRQTNSFSVKKITGSFEKELGWSGDVNQIKKNGRLLLFCITFKMLQCTEFREKVLSTGNRDIVEYPIYFFDNVYGTYDKYSSNRKLSIEEILNSGDVVKGVNLSGRCIMNVRKKYLNDTLEPVVVPDDYKMFGEDITKTGQP